MNVFTSSIYSTNLQIFIENSQKRLSSATVELGCPLEGQKKGSEE